MSAIRLIKKAEREKCAILPPDVADAVRAIVRQEQERLHRDEVFQKLRAMKSKVADLERRLTTE